MSKFTELTMGYRHRFKEWMYNIKYLSLKDDTLTIPETERNAVISMVDGRMWHGGLTDRFKGIVSAYLYAKMIERPFRIFYNFPFKLTEFLVPNEYDWTIEENEISNYLFRSRVLCARREKGKRLLKVKAKGQIRYYGNMDVTKYLDIEPFNEDWGKVFNHLFRPSPILQEEIDKHLQNIGGDYIAMVFRFQNLLGDFEEYEYKKIEDENYKARLIDANLNEIKKVIESEKFRGGLTKILVTSDSAEFLLRAQEFPEVYSITGKSAHIDTKGTGNTNHIKAFVDFLMISKAEEIFQVIIDSMYPSEFPIYAAKVGNVPLHRIYNHL